MRVQVRRTEKALKFGLGMALMVMLLSSLALNLIPDRVLSRLPATFNIQALEGLVGLFSGVVSAIYAGFTYKK